MPLLKEAAGEAAVKEACKKMALKAEDEAFKAAQALEPQDEEGGELTTCNF